MPRRRRGYSAETSGGTGAAIPRTRLAATSRLFRGHDSRRRRGYSADTTHGDAAAIPLTRVAATPRLFRENESRRRRGRDVDIPGDDSRRRRGCGADRPRDPVRPTTGRARALPLPRQRRPREPQARRRPPHPLRDGLSRFVPTPRGPVRLRAGLPLPEQPAARAHPLRADARRRATGKALPRARRGSRREPHGPARESARGRFRTLDADALRPAPRRERRLSRVALRGPRRDAASDQRSRVRGGAAARSRIA